MQQVRHKKRRDTYCRTPGRQVVSVHPRVPPTVRFLRYPQVFPSPLANRLLTLLDVTFIYLHAMCPLSRVHYTVILLKWLLAAVPVSTRKNLRKWLATIFRFCCFSYSRSLHQCRPIQRVQLKFKVVGAADITHLGHKHLQNCSTYHTFDAPSSRGKSQSFTWGTWFEGWPRIIS